MSRPVERVEVALRDHDCREQRPGRWTCPVPAHDDQRASLSLSEAQDGRALLKCHAECETSAVVAALGLTMADLFPPRASDFDISATYDYSDEQGRLLFQVVRMAPKGFRQRRPDGHGGWEWKLGNVRRVLYRLPKVLEAIRYGDTVWAVEGEKDVHALERAGVTATCNPMGAGKWRRDYTRQLEGAAVVIVADRDEAGYQHAAQVAKALQNAGNAVRVVAAHTGKDASDHLEAGLTPDDFDPVDLEHLDTDTEPSRPPVTVDRNEGVAILSEVAAIYRRFVRFTSEHQAIVMALWTAHSHAIEQAESTPYIVVESAEPESGKTRTLEVAECMVARPWRVEEVSEAALYRKIEQQQPTILLDETDALFGTKTGDREGLRAILNAGYRRGATVPRCVGEGSRQEVVDFAVFGAKALAGIGGRLPRTLLSRSIVLRLERRTQDEPIERFSIIHTPPGLAPLRDRLAAWVELARDDLADATPEIPEGLSDRQADVWEPLLSLAEAAGGDWPVLARTAALVLHDRDDSADTSVGVLLLRHIRDALGAEPYITTKALLEALCDRDDGPWAGWWERDVRDGKTKGPAARLRNLLKPYGVEPSQIWTEAGKARGYRATDFAEAWERYLPSSPQNTVGTVDTVGEDETAGHRVADPYRAEAPTDSTEPTELVGEERASGPPQYRCRVCGHRTTAWGDMTDLPCFNRPAGCDGRYAPAGS